MAAVTTPSLVSLRNILVATDFSPCSRIALQCAAALARQAKSKFFLAHIIPLEPDYPIPMDAGPPFPASATDANARMREAISAPELAGIDRTTMVEHGDFWQALQTIIHDNDIDLVVVGTHGRQGLKKLVLGSVAEEVFRRASCPVMTVGPHVAPDCFDNGRLRRIVFATDLSPSSMHALSYVTMLARQHQAPLTLVHAVSAAIPGPEFEPPAFVEREIKDAHIELRKIVPEGMDTDVVVEVGLPASIIVDTALTQGASLIVMGLHSQSVFAATHLPWTTAHRVVCDAHCPVLTVR